MSTISAYTGDGSTTQFDITFTYRKSSTIKASLDGVETEAFTFINPSRIQFDEAPESGAEIKIFRRTAITPAVVEFEDGAIIRGNDLNDAVAQPRDRVEELASEVDAVSVRAIKVPANESPVSIPAVAARIGKFAAWDAVGEFVASNGTGADDGLRTDMADPDTGPALMGFTPAGGEGATTTVRDELRRVVWLEQFFRAPDADYYNAFERAFQVLFDVGGGELRIGKGTFTLSSASLAVPIVVPSFVSIRGSGINSTKIEVSGTAVATAVFDWNNKRDIAISDLTMRGNGKVDAEANGIAIRAFLTATAPDNMRNFHLDRLRLENFGGHHLFFEHQSAASGFTMGWVFVNDVEAYSELGNTPAAWQSDTTKLNAVLYLSGFAGQITTVRIKNFYADADFIKNGIFLKNRVVDAVLDTVRVDNAGRNGATDDASAYAISCYDPFGVMARITIINPVINGPRSAGIYCANSQDITVINPRINGQTDSAAGTLGKGAIVFNGCGNGLKVLGGRLWDNWRDIHVTLGSYIDLDILLDGQTIRNTANNACSVLFEGSGTFVSEGVKIVNADWTATGSTSTSCGFANFGSSYINRVSIGKSRMKGTSFGLDLYRSNSSTPADYYSIGDDCEFEASSTGFRARDMSGLLRVRDSLSRGTFGTTVGWDFVGSTNLDLLDLTARDTAYGFLLHGGASGTTGRLRSINHDSGVAFAGALGLTTPTHAGKVGDRVQNLAPAAGGYSEFVYTAAGTWKDHSPIAA